MTKKQTKTPPKKKTTPTKKASPLSGLTQAQAHDRLEKYGLNALAVQNTDPWWKILYRQFADLLQIVLLVAAGISFFTGHMEDAIVIAAIIFLNSGIGFFQEFRTEQTLQAFKKMIKPDIRVRRAGKEYMISTEQLVPGDIVVLSEGDKIPADGILREAHSVKIEEAALTGESVPVEKHEDAEVFMGTSLVRGSAVMEVTATGMDTKFGEIARLAVETKAAKSPLQKELDSIGVFVTKVTVVICTIIFVGNALRGDDLRESLIFALSVAIASVPQGLPTAVTVALALGATALVKKKAIVKRLSSVETLGAVTTICSDKTGTLTKNEMTVREVYLADRAIYEVSGVGYDPRSGAIKFVGGNPTSTKGGNDDLLARVMEICTQCNEAKLQKKDGRYLVLGDPTEGALLTLAQKHGTDFPEAIDEIFPFDSERKMMSVLSGGNVLTKGSPDQLLEKCTHWWDGKKKHPLDKEKLERIRSHYSRMADRAMRVLAFAYRPVGKTAPTDASEAEKGLIYVGLVGMVDPPREEVYDAVKKCKKAGIRIVVITGDYGLTAQAVAQELGIVQTDNVRVFTGKETKDISDAELTKILKDHNQSVIFARSLPDQKMRVVSLLQKSGEVVAMTGDGVNDAPALKKADIGIAMGIAGTEVSKEAAVVVLTNDSFASIVTAVEEGRRIYANLKKFIWFIFSSNIGELVAILLSLILQTPPPLTAILILCVDMGTDILPSVALGVDTAEKDNMSRPPRDPKSKIMSRAFIIDYFIFGILMGIAATGCFLYSIYSDGWQPGLEGFDFSHGYTVTFMTIVLAQLMNTFSARSVKKSLFAMNPFENSFMLVAIGFSFLLLLAIVYTPLMNQWLSTAPMNTHDWLVCIAASMLPHLYVEIRKALIRNNMVAEF